MGEYHWKPVDSLFRQTSASNLEFRAATLYNIPVVQYYCITSYANHTLHVTVLPPQACHLYLLVL